MKCLCCRKPLLQQGPGLPCGAIDFRAYGNYGSSIWDPRTGEDLPLCVWVCDECILERKDCVAAFSRKRVEVKSTWFTWDEMRTIYQELYLNPEA